MTIDGSDIPRNLYAALESVEVDCAMFMPAMFVIRVSDPQLAWVDYSGFAIGAAVTITAVDALGASHSLIDGEITSLEPEYSREGFVLAVVRGYDKAHRLQRHRATQTFLQLSDSDIVQQVAQAAGLSVTCDSTPTVRDYELQDNETDYDFIQRLARRNNSVLMVSGSKATFGKPPGATEPAVALKFGSDVIEFRPRLTAASQWDSATVYGWDVKQKSAIVGTASSAEAVNSLNLGKDGHGAATKFGATGDLGFSDAGVKDQSEANHAAQSLLNRMRRGDINADGLCVGNPSIQAGHKVALSQLGDRFSGTYLVTRALHRYDTSGGYTTEIEVSNGSGETAADLVSTGSGVGARFHSLTERNVVVGIVTNLDDSEGGLGRVKVSFPWMPKTGSDIESAWARLASPMAGGSRGMLFYPEVNDEVLVAFEQGDPRRPYIIGALWNGTDATPIAQNVAFKDGKVEQRIIKTRAGHTILLDDSDSKKGIQVIDAAGKNKITIDSVGNKIIIEADTEMDIKSKTAEVDGSTQITIKGGKVSVTGSNISVVADAQLELTGKASVKISGKMLQIEGETLTAIKGKLLTLN